ncbi:pyridoxal phosphate-dependent transferase [Gongronella butleri]|nr:pyridoxal phosphate-dependent transferase [Gongronella butleri]
MTLDALVHETKDHLGHGIAVASDLLVDHASGCQVYMTNGQAYLDLTSGIGVTSTGHCHPTVVKAVQAQACKISHSQINMFYSQPLLTLIQRLKRYTGSLDTFCFNNSGSEAVESAIKLARHATKRPNIIVFEGGHHGRTLGALALTGSTTIFSAGFGPLMSGVYYVSYPNPFHCSSKARPGHTNEHCIQFVMNQLDNLFKQRCPPNDVAAILIEPVLGEGGYVPAPPGFFQCLRAVCDAHGILLIADEVQTGFGRTGRMFAMEHWGVEPDILVMAKGIASGYPLSAIAARKALMDTQPSGSMGGTYVGNVIACAAAVATLTVFEQEKLLSNVQARSAELLLRLRDELPHVLPSTIEVDIRGLGLMVGLEFAGAPVGFAERVTQYARDNHRLLLLTASIYETLRLIPPLIIDQTTLDDAITRLIAAVQDVVQDLADDGQWLAEK